MSLPSGHISAFIPSRPALALEGGKLVMEVSSQQSTLPFQNSPRQSCLYNSHNSCWEGTGLHAASLPCSKVSSHPEGLAVVTPEAKPHWASQSPSCTKGNNTACGWQSWHHEGPYLGLQHSTLQDSFCNCWVSQRVERRSPVTTRESSTHLVHA